MGYGHKPGLHLKPWSGRESLCWHLWLLLPLKAVQRTAVWDATWDRIDFQGPRGPCQSEGTVLRSGTMVTFRPRLLSKSMSVAMVLTQPGSELISLTCDGTRSMWMPRIWVSTGDNITLYEIFSCWFLVCLFVFLLLLVLLFTSQLQCPLPPLLSP